MQECDGEGDKHEGMRVIVTFLLNDILSSLVHGDQLVVVRVCVCIIVGFV